MKALTRTLWYIAGIILAIAIGCEFGYGRVAGQGEGACTDDHSKLCISFEMTVTYPNPRAFTSSDFGAGYNDILGKPIPEWVDHCVGRLSSGSYRYYVNGTAPSATTGTLVPIPQQVLDLSDTRGQHHDTTGTLEDDGSTVLLYNRQLVEGFKAMEVHGYKAVIYWECQKPGEPPPAPPPAPPRIG